MDGLTFVTDLDYDKIMLAIEHQGCSFDTLRISLQRLFTRKKIAMNEVLQENLALCVRIAPNFRHGNQRMIIQSLDTGEYDLVLVH